MFKQLLLLAEDSSFLTLQNGILLLLLVGILVGYKIYKNKQM